MCNIFKSPVIAPASPEVYGQIPCPVCSLGAQLTWCTVAQIYLLAKCSLLVVRRGSLPDELAREPIITFCQHEERQCSVTTDYADLRVGSGDVYSS